MQPDVNAAAESRVIETGRRNVELDGLRGYAAIAVGIFHTILEMDPTFTPKIVYGRTADLASAYDWAAKIILKLFSGETAVFIFFVLSGTVLFQSLMRDRLPAAALAPRFVIKRVLRIYPALIICLLVQVLVWIALGKPVALHSLLVNATLYDYPVNGVTWTLKIEMIAVPFVLLCGLAWRLAGLTGFIIAAATVWAVLKLPGFPGGESFGYFWMYFVLGMLVPTPIGAAVARVLPAAAVIPVLVIAIAFKATVQQFAIFCLVAMIFHRRSGVLGGALSGALSQFFGRISYSFYLYNFMVFVLICEQVRALPATAAHPLEIGLLTAVVTTLLTIPLAYLSVRFVEEPAIALGRAITARRKPVSA